jgi:hypothetical protein
MKGEIVRRWTTDTNTEALLDTTKEVGPEVNAEKTKYLSMSRHQTTGQKSLYKGS